MEDAQVNTFKTAVVVVVLLGMGYGGWMLFSGKWELVSKNTGSSVLPEGIAPGRHLLHARSLSFEAPSGEPVRVVAPWPEDYPLALVSAWETLGPCST